MSKTRGLVQQLEPELEPGPAVRLAARTVPAVSVCRFIDERPPFLRAVSALAYRLERALMPVRHLHGSVPPKAVSPVWTSALRRGPLSEPGRRPTRPASQLEHAIDTGQLPWKEINRQSMHQPWRIL